MTELQELYKRVVVPNLQKEFGFRSTMAVPCIEKITLNMGIGEAVADKKVIERAMDDMMRISGQKPVITYVRKSEASFKIRTGWPIGCKVTLRRKRMYEFLKRLISIVIPRIRDFRGFSAASFDKWGNFSLGIREQIVFPEIQYDKIDAVRGMDINITTTARFCENAKAQAFLLLKNFGFPLKD
ncbi:50S ribosomal protein L5 [Coxiella endosymbiont of Amblyomma americanum]|uniref:50S ribosomal protein L5 n=1 Tax=Coxiella endosymbiont of Amblyomma americanum TaxID=325775 RepID=UPI00057ED34E|nr:50S ribosomal protein L5 [Coxiella endosymbiont of Amblyomma americanum]AJC50435.1 50S ribosomal protein L5 [Coxiella endosymbiont of Amblyomma americanum]AUJ58775.1 50S ribosomal protein L5 [Coxiella-like endosymbiont of Amblyomma americanum]